MKTIEDVRAYLKREQEIARDPATPEWQIFTMLSRLAEGCSSVEQFIKQAQELPIAGPAEEANEARQWLTIALETIQGE